MPPLPAPLDVSPPLPDASRVHPPPTCLQSRSPMPPPPQDSGVRHRTAPPLPAAPARPRAARPPAPPPPSTAPSSTQIRCPPLRRPPPPCPTPSTAPHPGRASPLPSPLALPLFPQHPESQKEEERPKEKEKGKPRVIDKFLEELKFEQEQREKRIQDRDHRREGRHSDNSTPSSRFDELPDEFDPTGKFLGSFDDGDRQTTNLYVGNLSPKVDENFLLRTFGRFGPIASVKIMWPRTEKERRRQRNCGFVAFMNRADGQAAKDEMQGVFVYDYELKIGWGKSVALPSQALPATPPGHMAIRNKEVASFVLS
ncbi:hypothetical protein BS78_03G151800 [Paspalum vaginatum]|nr:hypothetical protein BS78_03G151800 [Paspalum vaginatum]